MKRSVISVFLVLAMIGIVSAAVWGQTATTAPPAKPSPAPTPRPLPPCPPGVTDLHWDEFFLKPVGPLGLQVTDKVKSLNGKRVRLLGFMVKREQPTPGVLFLTPDPTSIEEDEAGFSDLPPQTVRVIVPAAKDKVVPYTPQPLLLTGVLTIGNQEETKETAGGAVFLFHLTLDKK